MLGSYSTCPITSHYSQSGGADYYTGEFFQNGYGLGNLIGSIFRSGVPLLKRSAPAIAKTALNSLCNIGNEVLDGDTVQNAIKKQVFGQQVGSGYKRKRRQAKTVHSRKRRRKQRLIKRIKKPCKRKRKKKKKKRTARSKDIFG